MRLPTTILYGTRLMLDLALHYGEDPIPLRHIAQRQEISEKYLWSVMVRLKNIGLIRSTRGSHGGLALGRPPSEIDMREVIHALEGPLCLVECVDDPSSCKRSETCAPRDLWSRLSDDLNEVLESVTLSDMAENQRSKGVPNPYYKI
ncbi:RrF2 family transcriptional regulator [Candidatus Poribacteria bacterium]